MSCLQYEDFCYHIDEALFHAKFLLSFFFRKFMITINARRNLFTLVIDKMHSVFTILALDLKTLQIEALT